MKNVRRYLIQIKIKFFQVIIQYKSKYLFIYQFKIIFQNLAQVQMIQSSQLAQSGLDEQSENWEDKYKILAEKIANVEHEHKKIVNEIRNDLQFERKRANEFEEKYKSTIKYKNEQEQLKKILSQLNQKLTHKENQILEYIKSDQQKNRKISELDTVNEELSKMNEQIKQELAQIKQGAISVILEKDGIISNLEQKLIQFQNINSDELQNVITEQFEKIRDLQDKLEAEKRQVEEIVEMKDEQIRQIRDKIDLQRDRYEQKIGFLEQQIITFQKHIDKINEQRNHEQNLQQKYYLLEQKQRKTQKKLQQFENAYKIEKEDFIDAIEKLKGQIATKDQIAEQNKVNLAKIRQLQKQIKNKQKQVEDNKHTIQKTKTDYMKKIIQLQQQKKKIQDSLDAKSNELQRLRVQNQETKVELKTPEKKSTKQKQKDGSSLSHQLDSVPSIKSTLRRQSTQESASIIQKLKSQIKDLQENIDELNNRLEQQMRQVQSLRESLVQTSGSASRTEEQRQFLVQIEDLSSHIKKVQHILMNTRYKYAEDENHWKSKEGQFKKQIERLQKKSKKQKAELLQRIDRMKKTNVKDKKTDYYQSSLK